MKIEEVERAIKKQFEMKDSFKRKLNYWFVQGGYTLSAYGKSVLEQVLPSVPRNVPRNVLGTILEHLPIGKMDHILG